MTRKRLILGVLAILLAVPLLGAAFVYRMATARPGPQDLPTPEGAILLDSPEGQALLADALTADHGRLTATHQTQEQGAWCGVASSVTVINAATDPDITQDGLFTPEASAVRSWWKTTFGGMPIADLAGLIEAHGLEAEPFFAEDGTAEGFASEARRNLGTSGDYLIVNYDRKVVHEEGGGHISPISAMSADGRYLLLLDTATYKYPPHWVPTDAMFAAMNTPDSESGRSRGWVVVRSR